MKKRDSYWVNRIFAFLLITLVFGMISLFNILQFNSSYIQEEREELQVFKRQIEWAIKPYLINHNFTTLQKYCDDFQGEDIEFRIFNGDKKLIASSNPKNTDELLAKDSKILNPKYSKFKIYRKSMRDQKIGIREKEFVNGEKFYLEITVSQADVMKSIVAAQKSSLVFFIICLLLFISGLIQVFYTLRNSFNKLEDSVIEVANGNLDAEIEVPKLGLLKELTISIKKMTGRLKIQIERLKQLEQYKSEFLQNITHEIKTPITAINSAIELLQTKNSISQEDNECLDIIRFQIKSIDKLVNDILYLSETEVEKTSERKNFSYFNLNSMIKKVIDYVGFSDLEINLIEQESIEIYANEELLSTAISNLITNAIKYSKSDKIDVILSKSDKDIKLSIKDYGVGIKSEHLPHLFEKFYRVDKTRSRQLGGTGLGLAIVKNIVELHKGQISVQSEITEGTNFTITLPTLLN